MSGMCVCKQEPGACCQRMPAPRFQGGGRHASPATSLAPHCPKHGQAPFHGLNPGMLVTSKLSRATAELLPFPGCAPPGWVQLCHVRLGAAHAGACATGRGRGGSVSRGQPGCNARHTTCMRCKLPLLGARPHMPCGARRPCWRSHAASPLGRPRTPGLLARRPGGAAKHDRRCCVAQRASGGRARTRRRRRGVP